MAPTIFFPVASAVRNRQSTMERPQNLYLSTKGRTVADRGADGTVDRRSGDLRGLVRAYRRRAQLTQAEAADFAGLSLATLRDIEQGRVLRPRISTLRMLGHALGLSAIELSDLVREAGSKEPQLRGLRVDVLGPLRVSIDGMPVDPGSQTQCALLGLLALSPNVRVPAATLIDTILGGGSEGGSPDVLLSRMSRLRRRLQQAHPENLNAAPAEMLVSDHGGYRLVVAGGQHDLTMFRRHVARARQLRQDGDLVDACGNFARAVELWRGDALEGLTALQSNPAVVALAREFRTVVVEYSSVAADSGRYLDVLPLLQRLAEEDPLHEAVHAELMVALAGSGQQAAALTVFDTLRRRLAVELGVDPGPELTAAHHRVLRQEVPRPEFALVPGYRQLPPDIVDFSGRQAELRWLHERIAGGERGTVLPITVIKGMGGVGKTRLSVHLAHQLLTAGRYRDCQLYVDLRAHSGESPADPGAVLTSFLRLLGVPGSQIPPSVEERASLYRDRLYGMNALILLDNAVDENQVLPLLPAGPENLVLITSRRTLALDGAEALSLDLFAPSEARELLTRVIGSERVAAEPEAAQRVVELSGRLPLAVSLAARRLQARPQWRLSDLATRLTDSGDRLSELVGGGRRLRVLFELSYQALAADEQRMFRLLGLHPGDELTVDSAAALAAMTPRRTRHLLDRLVDENMLGMATASRYRLHDLVAEYAREVVRAAEPEQVLRDAVVRVLDFYVHTAAHATLLLGRGHWTTDLAGSRPAHLPVLSTSDDARQWLQAERTCLVSAATLAAEENCPAHAAQLSEALRPHLQLYGYNTDQDWMRTTNAAPAAAIAGVGEPEEVKASTELAVTYGNRGRSGQARADLRRELELHRAAGNRVGEISTLYQLGVLGYRLGDFLDALHCFRQARSSCAEGNHFLNGIISVNEGVILATLGEVDEALGHHQRGLALARYVDDPNAESRALAEIGDVLRRQGRITEAIAHLDRALAVALEHGLQLKLAHARHRRARVHRELGQLGLALAEMGEALRIVRTATDPAPESEILIDFGAIHRDTGDYAAAYELVEQGFRLATHRGERYQQARALEELAELHAVAARADLADESRRQADALFRELGMFKLDAVGETNHQDSVA